MLKACSKCGRVHEWDNCPRDKGKNGGIQKQGYSKLGGTHKRGYLKKWGIPSGERTEQQKFRSSSAWQRKRQEILERDDFVCRLCLYRKKLTRENLQIHHIIPIIQDEKKKLDNGNLITLCPSCHEEVENDKDKISLLLQIIDQPPAIGLGSIPLFY